MPNGTWLRGRVRHAIVTSSDVPVAYIEGIVRQGLGMTMESVGCSALAALELLDARATATDRPLYLVAVDVIERRHRPEPPDRAYLPVCRLLATAMGASRSAVGRHPQATTSRARVARGRGDGRLEQRRQRV